MLNPMLLRSLRIVGVEYLALVFLRDFAKFPAKPTASHLLDYLPFQMLAIAGPLLRLAVLARWSMRNRVLARSFGLIRPSSPSAE